MAKDRFHLRITDPASWERFEQVLEEQGIKPSTAIRFFARMVEEGKWVLDPMALKNVETGETAS